MNSFFNKIPFIICHKITLSFKIAFLNVIQQKIIQVKNLPAMQKTWVQSLGWEYSLKKRMGTQSSILAWRAPWTEEPGRLQPMGRKESDMTERLTLHYTCGTNGKEPICQCRRHKRRGFNPWIRKIPLEEGLATHSTLLTLRIHGQSYMQATCHRVTKSWT